MTGFYSTFFKDYSEYVISSYAIKFYSLCENYEEHDDSLIHQETHALIDEIIKKYDLQDNESTIFDDFLTYIDDNFEFIDKETEEEVTVFPSSDDYAIIDACTSEIIAYVSKSANMATVLEKLRLEEQEARECDNLHILIDEIKEDYMFIYFVQGTKNQLQWEA